MALREQPRCPQCGRAYRLKTNDEYTARAPCCDEKKLLGAKSKKKSVCGAVKQLIVNASDPHEIMAQFCAVHAIQDLLDDGPLLSAFEEDLIEADDVLSRRPPPGDPHSLSGMGLLGMYRIGVKSQVERYIKKLSDEVICTACYHPHTVGERVLTGAPHASKKSQVWTLGCPKCRVEHFRFV
jgi:hypothetical protein